MKRLYILRGQTANTFKPDRAFGYIPDVIRSFVEQYKFVEFPEAKGLLPPDINTAAPPAVFKHGQLDIGERSIIIDELHVYQLGILVTAQASTTDTDLIAEDVTRWATEHFKLTLEPITPSIHSSGLEVEFDQPLPQLFPLLAALGTAIRDGLGDFWQMKPEYELITLHWGFDPSKTPRSPNPFKIERRADMPFEKNLYYCEASMTTDSHIKVLELFERLCLNASR